MMIKKFLIVPILLLIFLSIGMVSATDDVLADGSDSVDAISHDIEETQISEDMHADEGINESSQNVVNNCPSQTTTDIKADRVTTYYKENSQLVGYLKDSNNQPIPNKRVSIFINKIVYDKITDGEGKVVLKLNLKPGTYDALFKFDGDENYAASSSRTSVKVEKATLTISAKNYKTYFESGFYFKVKVTNKITKNPVKGIKVAFKVYKNNKFKIYYAITDENGVAKLKKNLNVGVYKVVTSIKKNMYIRSKKVRSTLTIKETAEMGCSSLYVQVSNTEAVAGFRRDATNAKTLHIIKYKLAGKNAVKQYKTNSYFFHSITTSDGWMMGTGGWDNPTVNHAIEKLGGKIAKNGKITKVYLRKIQYWERKLPLGHFSIKAPNGEYGLVWANTIYTGKLKPGEYIKVPNAKSLFKHGKWSKLDKDPKDAAIKIAARDSFGVNRRDVTVFHWKANTTEGKTTSTIKVYAANDNGKLVGKNTGHLKDNIIFKGRFLSKNKLPKTPSSKFLGTYNMGSIDKFKIQTIVNAPKLTKDLNESKAFAISVKDKKTKNPIKGLKLKLNIGNKVYTIITDSEGVANFNTDLLEAGIHNVVIFSGNDKYYVSAKSTITVT